MSKPFIFWQRRQGSGLRRLILVVGAIGVGGVLGWLGNYFGQVPTGSIIAQPRPAVSNHSGSEVTYNKSDSPASVSTSKEVLGKVIAEWSARFRSSQNLGSFVHDAITDGSLSARLVAKRAVVNCFLLQGSGLSPNIPPSALENSGAKSTAERLAVEAARCRTLTDVYPDLGQTMRSIGDSRYTNPDGLPPYWLTGAHSGLTLGQRVSDFDLAVGTGDPEIIQQSIQGLFAGSQIDELRYNGQTISKDEADAMVIAFDLAMCERTGGCIARDIRICNLDPRDCGTPIWDIMKRDSSAEQYTRLVAFKDFAMDLYSTRNSVGKFGVAERASAISPPR